MIKLITIAVNELPERRKQAVQSRSITAVVGSVICRFHQVNDTVSGSYNCLKLLDYDARFTAKRMRWKPLKFFTNKYQYVSKLGHCWPSGSILDSNTGTSTLSSCNFFRQEIHSH